MSAAASDVRLWGGRDDHLDLVARNVSTRYAALAIDAVIGVLLLPFNLAYLGPAAYGLWALMAAITVHFSVLDLGYGGALVRFVAQYRAWRDRSALNEILSTMAVVFTLVGLATLAVTATLAFQVDRLFQLPAGDAIAARQVLLMIGGFVALRFTFSVFGAVVYGFQRAWLNSIVGVVTSVAVALVNVAVLLAGYGLVELVAATTLVRVLSLGAFVWTARRVYPGLHLSPTLFRRARLREVTGFSLYMLMLDWSLRVNYSAGTLVIGALAGTTAVAVWTVGQRLADLAQRVTNQFNDALFPLVVDSDAANRGDRLRLILVQGSRLSLALATPVCIGLIVLADRIVEAWVGSGYEGAVFVTRVLLATVLVRVGTSSASLILKGARHPRLAAFTNAATAATNLTLSIALIGRYGLPGVALGTFVPVTIAAVGVILAAACRRVGVSMGEALREAIWPATWPAAGTVLVLWWSGTFWTAGLVGLAVSLALGVLIYAALFFGLAIPPADRAFYRRKAVELAGRYRRLPAAA